MMHRDGQIAGSVAERRDCACCEAVGTVTSRPEVERFVYGAGRDAATLETQIQVWTCSACGDAFVDGEAEELRHAAVCRHLGRPTPDDLRAFREARKLSQRGLAELTGYGPASIKRWEAGFQVPSASAAAALHRIMSDRRGRPVRKPVFRTSFGAASLRRAATFRLDFARVAQVA